MSDPVEIPVMQKPGTAPGDVVGVLRLDKCYARGLAAQLAAGFSCKLFGTLESGLSVQLRTVVIVTAPIPSTSNVECLRASVKELLAQCERYVGPCIAGGEMTRARAVLKRTEASR